MNWSAVDHLFVLVFVVVYPAVGYIGFRRLLRRIEAGGSVPRLQLYAHTMAGHWLLLVAGVAVWGAAGRDWSALGLGIELDGGFALGAVLAGGGIVFLARQLVAAQSVPAAVLPELRERFGVMRHLVPHSENELTRFYLLSMTAGIVEEVLWRGFLIAYLLEFMSLPAAAAASTLAFGLAHAYQGAAALPRVTLVGGVFTALFLLSGSVWLPVVLHGAVDMLQGRFAYLVNRRLETGT